MTRTAAARRAVLLAPLVVTSLAVGGCGGTATTSPPSASTPPTSLAADLAGARTRFIECLEAHGVPVPVAADGFRDWRPRAASPAPTAAPAPKAVNSYASAFEACRSQLPTPGLGGMGGTNFLNSPAGRAYVTCLENHGLTPLTSTPAPPSGPDSFAGPGAFRTAERACANLAPKAVFGGTRSTTTRP